MSKNKQMKGFLSECHGAEIKLVPQYDTSVEPYKKIKDIPICVDCLRPTKPVEAKEKGG